MQKKVKREIEKGRKRQSEREGEQQHQQHDNKENKYRRNEIMYQEFCLKKKI